MPRLINSQTTGYSKMSLTKRIIPVLLTRDGMLVKGKQFNSSRVVGNVQQAAEIHQGREVDEMLVLDVGATVRNQTPDCDMVSGLTEKCFMPITVGGGIRSIEHVRDLLASGADKVVIGTLALDEPEMIYEFSSKFGSQAITVAVDAVLDSGGWFITSRCGRETHFYSAVAFAQDMERLGAGELIVTNIKNDGMMRGYDIGLIRAIAKVVSIPIIANGGCGSYEHMHRALQAGADAVAAGSFFQWTNNTPLGAARYLAKKGWEVRS